jgi:prepilin peptidase CpaA
MMTVVIIVVLALAVREDLLRHRIPNSLNLAGLVLAVGLAFLIDGVGGALTAAGGAVVGAAALLPFYLLRGMGAGDVKLMAVAGAFLGPFHALLAAAMALMAGAVLAVIIVGWRLVEPRPPVQSSSAEAASTWRAVATISTVGKERFPYALAIATGVVAMLWQRGSISGLLALVGVP